jgi:hypothetical protein
MITQLCLVLHGASDGTGIAAMELGVEMGVMNIQG